MPTPPLTALVVDDEPLARERLCLLLRETETAVDVIGEAADGKEAAALIRERSPDIVFLDIRMPMLDGFDVLDLLPDPRPYVVFVTAHEEHALDAFDVHAADYLTKPVRLSRLQDTLDHLAGLSRRPPGGDDDTDDGADEAVDDRATDAEPIVRMTVEVGSRLRVIDPADVRYFEAEDKLVFAHHADGTRHVVDFTLKTLRKRFDATDAGPTFLRTHRSVLVNVSAIEELIPWFSGTYRVRLSDGTKLPVARRRLSHVKQRLGM